MINLLETTYTPNTLEAYWRKQWEDNHYFKPTGDGASFCIMLPPPNVTGTLHMGHGFQQTLMDALIRYHRMQGDQTLWQGGTDHAGIATQMVVDRQLSAQGINKHDLGREAFIDKIWEWKATSSGRIGEQIREMGASIDWSRDRFTMDDGLQTATKTAFVKLFRDGLIYRGKRLVNWDPKFQTAISDLEVLNVEKKGHLWFIRYPLISNPSKQLIVATTRPETMLGDVAVAVHPDDARYQDLIGQSLQLPLTNRTIPIIADSYVDPEFGTGCVKITPAHDFNDYAMGKRHNFDPINILNPDATLNEVTPAVYQGLTCIEARKKIIADLEAINLIEKIDDHTLQVPTGDRSGAVIEPLLTDQWFIEMKPLAQPALQAVKNGDLKFIPEGWTKTYCKWLEDIEDWCISRQLWWGHRVPAYYDDTGKHYVGMDEADVRAHYQLSDDLVLHQDEDVLDTWFTSALWPFATLGWPEKTPQLETFYPTQTMVTGFDLIFFWVARMVMFGLKFMGQVPFKEVYLHGLIRDSKGNKMSKSKGNVLDPLDLIHGIDLESLQEKRTATMMQPHIKEAIVKQTKKEFPDGITGYGTDALRFTFCALASTSRNINFDLGRIEGYRNFCNKLFNASKFVLQNTSDMPSMPANFKPINNIDHWILSALNQTIEQAHQHLAVYRFDLLATCLYEFVWNVYCDWYLELAKCVCYSDDFTTEQKQSTQWTLLTVLENICRLLHPIIPFVTETIWQNIKAPLNLAGDTLMLMPYPKINAADNDQHDVQAIEQLQAIISAMRALRAQLNISPKTPIPMIIKQASTTEQALINDYMPYIKTLINCESIAFVADDKTLPPSASCFIEKMSCHVPLAGLIDVQAELKRTDKAIIKAQKEIEKIEKKLANENYIAKAPEQVVAEAKQALTDEQALLDQLHKHAEEIKSLGQ